MTHLTYREAKELDRRARNRDMLAGAIVVLCALVAYVVIAVHTVNAREAMRAQVQAKCKIIQAYSEQTDDDGTVRTERVDMCE